MIAALTTYEDYDLDDSVASRETASPRILRERSSRDRLANRARYRRGKGASSFNGAHRRCEKRNYL